MPTMTRFCPKCAQQLAVPQPPPEKVMCPKCRAVLKFATHTKDGARHAEPVAAFQPAQAHAPARPAVIGATGTVAGHELRRELARGGLGVVYLGYHTHLEDFRAIKRPQERDGVDRDVLLARFRREVQSMGGITSQHVIRAYDAGIDADGPYLVMEYLDGDSLSGLVARHNLLPVPEACEIIRQAALGLQAAHERGLVHRDVKPSNLMLARTGAAAARVVVIDWGLVKRGGDAEVKAARLTQLGAEMGTPDYIAPEQVKDARSADIRADIYSLGITLYFLLAGRPPFFDRSDEHKLHAQVHEDLPPLEQSRPSVPKKLLAVLAMMVNKSPNERYQTPGEVADALQPFCCAGSAPLLALLPPASKEQVATPPLVLRMEDVLAGGARLAAPSTPIAANRSVQDGLLTMPTMLGTAPRPVPLTNPQAVASPPRSRWWIAALLAVAAGFLLVATVGGLVLREEWKSTKPAVADGDDKDKPGSGRLFIDEDFRSTSQKKETLPSGWEGDAYGVIKENDEPCLAVNKLTGGPHFVKLPGGSFTGDFIIEGSYFETYNQTVVIRLESRKTNAMLPIVLDHSGKVAIGDDARAALPTYKAHSPTQFILKRDGKRLRVFLNGDPVADKDLGAVTEYESLQLSLTGLYNNRSPRLFRLKAGIPGPDGQLPPSNLPANSPPVQPVKDRAKPK